MNGNIVLGIVTYKPCANLTRRLKNAIDLGYSVYIFDNSPECSTTRAFCQSFSEDIVKYSTCGKNVGLGLGMSFICAQAYYDSHKALIFFDQDTGFSGQTLDFINIFYRDNKNLMTDYSAILFNSKNISTKGFDDKERKEMFNLRDVMMAINSGSLFFLENLKKIGWHNERFFVDGVDYEFCLNSSNNNLKIGECSLTPDFDHESEQDDLKYNFFGKVYMLRRYTLGRVLDAVSSNLRLLVLSIKTRNYFFTIKICRLLVGYLFYQIVARMFKYSNSEEEDV
jgi:rhamnosyltransferase